MKLRRRWTVFLLLIILAIHIFLRFFELEKRLQFTWDQVQNAWVMKEIIVDKTFPTMGMVARLNSPIRIGPLYYYVLAPFYFIFGLDPIASGVFAGVISIVTFLVLFRVVKELFSEHVALLASFIYAVSNHAIIMDRISWPVIFIPLLSLLIFLALYKTLTGQTKYVVLLGLCVGLMFHIHLTALFYPLIILLAVPLLKKSKNMNLLIWIAILISLGLLTPILVDVISKTGQPEGLGFSASGYYHGFHLRRVWQVLPDALIEFESILFFPALKPLKYILFPLFGFLYIKRIKSRDSKILVYLMTLWFLVPHLVLSTYSGEISNYYFSLTRPVILAIVAWLLLEVIRWRWRLSTALVMCFLVYYTLRNISTFMERSYGELPQKREKVKEAIRRGIVIDFMEGAPESYLYYYYTSVVGQKNL